MIHLIYISHNKIQKQFVTCNITMQFILCDILPSESGFNTRDNRVELRFLDTIIDTNGYLFIASIMNDYIFPAQSTFKNRRFLCK